MLTIDDPRVNFHRKYVYGTEEFCYRVWIGDLNYEPAGICIWACGVQRPEIDRLDESPKTVS